MTRVSKSKVIRIENYLKIDKSNEWERKPFDDLEKEILLGKYSQSDIDAFEREWLDTAPDAPVSKPMMEMLLYLTGALKAIIEAPERAKKRELERQIAISIQGTTAVVNQGKIWDLVHNEGISYEDAHIKILGYRWKHDTTAN
ncbi:MAG: hypothetical protein AAB116_17350 [Candidatus Poribacteria bacterium]